MRTKVEMQRLGPDMETGFIVRWLKQVGERVAAGEPIVEVETDKVTVDMPAIDGGTLVEIVRGPDTEVPVGEVIGWLEP
jgi:pyruvate/2-oxoglutarate dehydrogenase complex dihydrolipoamide acyltransferase (E2) component